MSPLVWDLAHIGNQEELWLLRDVGGRDPILPETVDQLYDAFQHPRARPAGAAAARPGRTSRSYVGEVRRKVLDLLDATPLRRTPAHRERVRLRHDRPARAAARRDDARHPPAAAGRSGAGRAAAAGAARPGRPAGRGAGARRAVHHGHLDRTRGRWTTSGRRTSVARAERSGSTPSRSPTRDYLRVHRRRRLRRRRAGGLRPAGRTARRPACTAPLFWQRDGDELAAPQVRP